MKWLGERKLDAPYKKPPEFLGAKNREEALELLDTLVARYKAACTDAIASRLGEFKPYKRMRGEMIFDINLCFDFIEDWDYNQRAFWSDKKMRALKSTVRQERALAAELKNRMKQEEAKHTGGSTVVENEEAVKIAKGVLDAELKNIKDKK